MPKDTSIKKVLVIGSGPIIIGQAAEFDYSGTQACRAFKEEGVEVVLINSNPATIMTDPGMADYTYIEPLSVEFIEKIIAKERPDSIIAGMGGQTGLNMACELYDLGILDKYGVRVIGSSIETIKEGEDRERFKNLMKRINEPIIESETVNNIEAGIMAAEKIGYPVIIRPAYTLGGSGGGTAENEDELKEILALGLSLSRVNQVLVEKSIKGWKEIEFEVIRDSYGNCITVCSMENVDPVGVHTGDSIVVAPAQTLSAREYDMLKKSALSIINEIKIEGGCNVQFALEPNSFDYTIIEINPRVSRSSALASKATGYPIAKVACKIALGYALDEIRNVVTGSTYACFEPAVDYVVLKIPKWPFDKFTAANRTLGTKMMATGEVMAIGSNFEQAFLKGIRSLEIGQYSLERPSSKVKTLQELRASVCIPDDERIFDVAEMIRRNYLIDKVCEITGMDAFFINKIKKIVDMEEQLKEISVSDLDPETLLFYKVKGFADRAIAEFVGCDPIKIYNLRKDWGITPVYKMVDTCAGEFPAVTPYYYSTYDEVCETVPSLKKKVLVIGSGPIRIGQGIEFDYCSVHSVLSLKKIGGIETIIINNNPETVSTDFDTSDKLYFEPLTEEDVLNVVEKEKPNGVILQFGGQTAIKLADFLRELNIPIYGTKPEQIDAAEDREKFDTLLSELSIARPEGRGVRTLEEGLDTARELGFPLLVRPSYVLGGQGMQITYDSEHLEEYLANAFKGDNRYPVLVDKYLSGREIEVDAICDGKSVFIPGIMEHLERAGVHSGDSISIYPPQNLSEKIRNDIIETTRKISLGLKIIGMINIQYIEYENELYIIEVNPRSSRTVPYISKVTGVPVIELATRVMLGETLTGMGIHEDIADESALVAVKVPVFSTEKLSGVEVTLGPEMRSTGEVMGIGKTYVEAMHKGFLAAKLSIPKKGDVIITSVRNEDHQNFLPLAKRFAALGCVFKATKGTAALLTDNGIKAETIRKINEPRPYPPSSQDLIDADSPSILDVTHSGLVKLAIHIPRITNDTKSDAFAIRRATMESGVSLLTSLDTVHALLEVCESGLTEQSAEIVRMV